MNKNVPALYLSLGAVAISSLFCGLLCHSLNMALLAASAVLVQLPVGKESPMLSLGWMCASSAVIVLFSAVGKGPSAVLIPSMVLDFLFLASGFFSRYSTTNGLFQYNAAIVTMAYQVRMFYAMMVYLSSMVIVCSVPHGVVSHIMTVFLLALVSVMVYRGLTGKTLILLRHLEQLLGEMVRGNLRPGSSQSKSSASDEKSRMEALYAKILEIMEKEQPYLDCEYSLGDLAQSVASNKTYLSRTINVCSGKNFRQFINSYRISYAVQLMKENPGMRMTHISQTVGFNNTVSFTMSFKLFMGSTPGEYLP